jgi:hypothetical protein
MADIRTLKLSLLADVNKFVSGMNDADNSTKNLNTQIGGYSKKMAKAFLGVAIAVGTMAIAIGVDSVKAVADDEVSQKKFQETLKDTAGVVDKTVVRSINDWIERMQFATGYSDGELRDAMGRLTRSTGDVSTAQDILQVAMDTSRGTGKDLSTVTDTLAKAYDGNYTPLKKMGVKLDENTVSTKDFNGVLDTLTQLFGGQAATYADTYQGKLDIVNQRFGELKESAGAPLLGVLSALMDQVGMVAKAMGGEDPQSLSQRARELAGTYDGQGSGGYNLGLALKNMAGSFSELFDALNSSDSDNATASLNALADALNAVAKGIGYIAGAADTFAKFKKTALGQLLFGTWGPNGMFPGLLNPASLNGARAMGGPVSAGGSYLVGENGPEILNMGSRSGSIVPNNQIGGGGVTINLNGILDAESARRSIEQLIQRSARRTGAIDWVGATL